MKSKSIFLIALILLNSIDSIFMLQAGADSFNGINLAKGFKEVGKNHNPCLTQKFTADPGVMVYNDRVYVYGTNDGYLQSQAPGGTNTYGQINTINVMSSSDLVNWSDHGSINVAGGNGAAKWASNSWAPTACHKTINGREKFFLYFANNASGIGVLVADSPTGPFTDPKGGPLISRQTPNSNVEWLFDPAVLVDTDGTGYLYYGGGVPNGAQANPNTIRAVKLGDDMISIVGTPVNIQAPWVFEDSGINKVDNTYYYSYCTNWSGGPYGNANIAYMTSSNPLGPFTYKDVCFKNQGTFFGQTGNNHHTIINFNSQFYIFYHSEWLNKQTYGDTKGYRTTHVDKMPFANGGFGNAIGTLAGVDQIKNFDPYQTTRFNTMAWQGGIEVKGLGDSVVAYNRGDWTGLSNVDFGDGAKSITVTGKSNNGADIRISIDSPSGQVLGYVTIGNSNAEVTATISGATGVKNVFFVASGDVELSTFKFSK